MADPSSASDDRDDGHPDRAEADAEPDGPGARADEDDVEALRAAVEEKYDFDDFGPADMAEMTAEEWDAAFDADSWIVGTELLDRLERELQNRVRTREVFAVIERGTHDGEEALLAYSDEGYALVYADGSVEGRGTVLRDVKPSVALCSMDGYEVADHPPDRVTLPTPEEVSGGSGEFGNLMLQVIAGGQMLAGGVLVGAWVLWWLGLWPLTDLSSIVVPVIGVVFVLAGLFLFTVVANARLSDRFRAEEYRTRLRDLGLEDGERPAFVPSLDDRRRSAPSADGDGRSGAER